jgi:indolepyruvate ferredoxin oxidoreductase beta subunit
MKEITNIVISGVGGQGVLMVSELIGNAAMYMGLDVRVTETHGLSQRGGSLLSYVRIGKVVHSPLVELGGADYIISMELLEAMRTVPYSSKRTIHIVNLRRIPPATVMVGKATYPSFEQIRSTITKETNKAFFVDAYGLARKAGGAIFQNVVMMGFFSKASEPLIERPFYEEAIRHLFKGKHIDSNIEAFRMGYEAGREMLSHITP